MPKFTVREVLKRITHTSDGSWRRWRAWWQGFVESRGDLGLTWGDDPYHPLSQAYDAGRAFGCWLLGRD